jgi:hypothetical protein
MSMVIIKLCVAQENRGMLGTYFVMTLILFILCIVGVVWSYKGDIDSEIKDPLTLAMEKYEVKAIEIII